MTQARDLADGTFDSTTLVVDSANNRVGVGTASPSVALDVVGEATVGNGTYGVKLSYSGGNTSGIIDTADSANTLEFRIANSEKMRIDSSGNLLVGTTTGTGAKIVAEGPNSITAKVTANSAVAYEGIYLGTGTGYFGYWKYGASVVGSISSTGSSTSYNTTSDYRLKTAVTYDWDATSRLKQLKPARFEWIADGDDAVPVDGFLAHEVQDIVPEAISGTKDGVDVEGNPVYQGIDQSKLVPLLVKTIQELEARIVALENA